MEIKAYQIHNVLRTYGHFEKLKASQTKSEGKMAEKPFFDPLAFSDTLLPHFNLREDFPVQEDSSVEDEIQTDLE